MKREYKALLTPLALVQLIKRRETPTFVGGNFCIPIPQVFGNLG